MARIAAIYRYPVKGLSPQPLDRTHVAEADTIPFDRAYAIENGPSQFDPATPRHLPKISFLMLMRNERLAGLRAVFDETIRGLRILKDGAVVADGRLDADAGKRAIEAYFNRAFANELRGPVRILAAPGHSFSDCATKVVSLINLASVRELEPHVGLDVNPLRFRGNIYAHDLPAWAEFNWIGQRIAAGGIVAEVVARIDRCAATNVNPLTAARDMNVPQSLQRAYGHSDCGVYLKIAKGGGIAVGDTIVPV